MEESTIHVKDITSISNSSILCLLSPRLPSQGGHQKPALDILHYCADMLAAIS
ncbi:Uncharacterized protein DAT39_004565 [Clarias magur]|uniref:Uncharacterized protein n=1 Tax=Clarias magur TaxID=1594786 RepID=A0A8J4X8N5_CLAMG|nr:Uncharacterized protein DAT39_004565 [Clarias magur]